MDALFRPRRRSPLAPTIEQVAALARCYCALIETSGRDRSDWLPQVAALLPRLHAAMTGLSVTPVPRDTPRLAADLDARFDLFARLRRLLADRDGYWLEFDGPGDGDMAMTGSLADDLTDIYCELQEGLRTLPRDPASAVAVWTAGYDRHWNRHLLDAERHLAALAARGRLAA